MYKLSLEDKEQLTGTSLSSLQGGQEGLRESFSYKTSPRKIQTFGSGDKIYSH